MLVNIGCATTQRGWHNPRPAGNKATEEQLDADVVAGGTNIQDPRKEDRRATDNMQMKAVRVGKTTIEFC